MVTEVAGTLRLLLIALVLPVYGSEPCWAQDERPAASATRDEAAADNQQKQRTAASALVTLAGIVLAGLALVFIILLLGAWTRRIVKVRRANQGAESDKSESTGDPPTEPPGEDAT